VISLNSPPAGESQGITFQYLIPRYLNSPLVYHKSGGDMEATVKWHGKMSFTGSAETGFEVPLDTFPAVGGENNGFRPLELMAISLAGCTAMDVISILNKMRQDVTNFKVSVHVEQATEHPKVFTAAVIDYCITGHAIDEKAFLRAIELSATRYCPAQSMLTKVFPMRLTYQVFEDQGDLEPASVARGEWMGVG
jgi:putative redox protein